jgi:hypothetical protein
MEVETMSVQNPTRRDFLRMMGAGTATLGACVSAETGDNQPAPTIDEAFYVRPEELRARNGQRRPPGVSRRLTVMGLDEQGGQCRRNTVAGLGCLGKT